MMLSNVNGWSFRRKQSMNQSLVDEMRACVCVCMHVRVVHISFILIPPSSTGQMQKKMNYKQMCNRCVYVASQCRLFWWFRCSITVISLHLDLSFPCPLFFTEYQASNNTGKVVCFTHMITYELHSHTQTSQTKIELSLDLFVYEQYKFTSNIINARLKSGVFGFFFAHLFTYVRPFFTLFLFLCLLYFMYLQKIKKKIKKN